MNLKQEREQIAEGLLCWFALTNISEKSAVVYDIQNTIGNARIEELKNILPKEPYPVTPIEQIKRRIKELEEAYEPYESN